MTRVIAVAAAVLCLIVTASTASPSVDYATMRLLGPIREGKAALWARSAAELAAADHTPSSGLPVNFDGRTAFPGCIHSVLDQGHCGSCWSFAATETLSDRFCIASNGRVNTVLSPQNLLSCEHLNLKCEMGSLPEWAWHFLNETGVATLQCVPYVSGDGHSPACTHSCNNSSIPYKLYKAKNYRHVGNLVDSKKHIEAIMAELLHGPVDATFNVYKDFDAYTSGVYVHKSGPYEGLHSVKVIGYGVDAPTNLPYWLVQNSWGPAFGEDGGFFRILRGANECGFEELMYTGDPLL